MKLSNLLWGLGSVVLLFIGGYLLYFTFSVDTQEEISRTYLALGDSYTVGEGLASHGLGYTEFVIQRLDQKGLAVELLDSPAVSGAGTDDVFVDQVSKISEQSPDIISLLVGTNDLIKGYSVGEFETKFKHLLDKIDKESDHNTNIILISIPDYSLTPIGQHYVYDRNVFSLVREYNEIIETQARLRGYEFADVYPVSLQVGTDTTLTSQDGLHPSEKLYSQWADVIVEEMEETLIRINF